MREVVSTPEPPVSVPSVGVSPTDVDVYQGPALSATDGVVGAVVSFVIVTVAVLVLPPLSVPVSVCAPGEVVAPAPQL